MRIGMFLRGVVACLLGTSVFTALAAQGFPSGTIRIVVPYPPGGSTNVLARVVGEKLSANLGQPVIVDNRPGGNTTIGTAFVAQSPPDGHTLLLTLYGHIVAPMLAPAPYDPIKDFVPVGTIASGEILLVTHPSVKADNLRDLIALAKASPGKLNYGTSGRGSVLHIAAEIFNGLAGVKTTEIAYKGTGPALVDLLGGHIHMYFSGPLAALPHVKEGRLKAMAYSGDTRFPGLPDIPTFTEAGLPGYDGAYWYGVLAPAKTPPEVVRRLSEEFAKVMVTPEVKATLSAQGINAFVSSPQAFLDLLKKDTERFSKILAGTQLKQQ